MDILAGTICGLFMGTVSLGAMILIFLSHRDIYDRLARWLPKGITPGIIMLSLVIVSPIIWGIWGAIAGLLYNVILDLSPSTGLGSSNFTFTLAILCLTAILMLTTLLLILTRRKWGWLFLVVNLIFAGVFGWLLPLLANWR